MLPTRSSRVLFVAFVLSAVACNGPGTKAYSSNAAHTFALFALTGAPSTAPTAINFQTGPVAATANFSFDLAVDIDNTGITRLYPVRLLEGKLSAAGRRVGLQVVPGTFESLREAPGSGYDTLSAQAVKPGTVVAVELLDIAFCQYTFNGSSFYAKLVVDSIIPTTRRVYGRTVTDPNCGFRQLMPDTIPSR